jgi:hypothetical protein
MGQAQSLAVTREEEARMMAAITAGDADAARLLLEASAGQRTRVRSAARAGIARLRPLSAAVLQLAPTHITQRALTARSRAAAARSN